MRTIKFFAITLLGFFIISCSDDNNNLQEYFEPINLTSAEAEVSEASSTFAWELFNTAINQNSNDKNIVISPLSANVVLTAIATGADEDTKNEIFSALHYDNLEIEAVNSFTTKTLESLTTIDPSTTVKFANSLWSSFEIKQNYINALANYNLETFSINASSFSNDVNKWANDKTNGMIYKIIGDGEYSDFLLLNATYFKGIWCSTHKFDKKNTNIGQFHNSDGSISDVNFMNNTTEMATAWTDKTAMCALEFGNHAYKLWLILPDEGVTIKEAVENLAQEWNHRHYSLNNITLKVPKFEINDNQDLSAILQTMGIQRLFNSSDLGTISDTKFSIDAIKQFISFKINEDGAEAAAITEAIGDISPGPIQKGKLTFDRPFIYLIEGRPIGNILFIGQISSL